MKDIEHIVRTALNNAFDLAEWTTDEGHTPVALVRDVLKAKAKELTAAGWTQRAIANETGLDQSTISRMMHEDDASGINEENQEDMMHDASEETYIPTPPVAEGAEAPSGVNNPERAVTPEVNPEEYLRAQEQDTREIFTTDFSLAVDRLCGMLPDQLEYFDKEFANKHRLPPVTHERLCQAASDLQRLADNWKE